MRMAGRERNEREGIENIKLSLYSAEIK